jgi:hypothetical protein
MATPEASIINFLFPKSSLQLLPLGPESLVAQISTLLALDQRLASLPGFEHENRPRQPDGGELLFAAALLEYASSIDNHEEAIFLLRDWWKRRCAQDKLRMDEEERSRSCGEDSTKEEPVEEQPTEEQPTEPTELKVCNFEILEDLYDQGTELMHRFSQEIIDKAAENGFPQLKDDCHNVYLRCLETYSKIEAILTAKLHALPPLDLPPTKICLECFESLEHQDAYQSKLFKGFKEEDMQLVIAGKMILKWLEVVAETLTADVKDRVIEDITSILKTAFKSTA